MNGPNDGWEQLPRDFRHLDVADVAVDSRDRVYALTRYDSRVIVYEPDGTFIRSWGEPFLSARPHGLTIGPDDCAYLVDDGDQTVKKYTLDGQLLLTLGTSGESSDTGIDRAASSWAGLIESIKGGPPFNRPTSAAVAPNGDLYVADGYGNCKVHHYDSSGNLIESFGEPGGEPGAFRTPHDITIDPLGRLLVADRENERIQVFDAAGNFVEQWSDMRRPSSVVTSGDRVFVAEFPIPVGGYTWPRGENYEYVDARISVYDLSGERLAEFGADGVPWASGNFVAPHGLDVDSKGNLFVAEVTHSYLHFGKELYFGKDQLPLEGVPEDVHTLQRFELQLG